MFFFSSRRRHTRYIGDWSSDVCSSDLQSHSGSLALFLLLGSGMTLPLPSFLPAGIAKASHQTRSEERRVGKECRSRWARYDLKSKTQYSHRTGATGKEDADVMAGLRSE